MKRDMLLLIPLMFMLNGCSFVKKLVFTIDNSMVLGEPQSQSDCVDFIGDVSKPCQEYLEAKKQCEEGNYDKVVIPLEFRDLDWGKELKRTCDEKDVESLRDRVVTKVCTTHFKQIAETVQWFPEYT